MIHPKPICHEHTHTHTRYEGCINIIDVQNKRYPFIKNIKLSLVTNFFLFVYRRIFSSYVCIAQDDVQCLIQLRIWLARLRIIFRLLYYC